MKTYPEFRDDGSLHAFEITSLWFTLRPIFKILRSVDGITDVRRNWFSDDRITFKYFGTSGVVNEPWGDSSRYWIGLTTANTHIEPRIEEIEAAFKKYKPNPLISFWYQRTNGS